MEIDPNLARRCARKWVESEIWSIRHDAPYHLWTVCAEEYQLLGDDDDARDELYEAVCRELDEVTVTYQFRGESAEQARRWRLQAELERAEKEAEIAQERCGIIRAAIERLERDSE